MAPNIPQSGTAGRSVWYTGVRSLFRVFEPGGCDDVEAGARLYGRAGAVRAAPRGAGPRGYRRQRDDDHRPGGRPELLHHERRVRRRPQGMRAGVRQGGRATRRPVQRRHDLRPGELQARRSAELEARAVHRSQGEGDGDAPHGERSPHDRDQDGLGRDLMRRTLGGGAAVLSAALLACGSRAPSGFTLLFLGRSPAASVDGLSWAPDPERSRLVAFDRQLRLARRLTSPRLGTPMAVAALPGGRLLVTERTGEGVVLDTAGQPVREWDSPDVASLYAASAGRIVAARSPYYVPELGSSEPDTAPLLRVLDTLGRPVEGLATIRVPAIPLLTHLVNAGAVAVGPDGSVYYAPLVRDEIRKYAPSGAPRWTARRGLISKESEPVFLPARGKELRLANALVNVALALGPDGRLYALGADDSAATKLRVDVLDTATGAIVATRHLGPRETAVAVSAAGGGRARHVRRRLAARRGACGPGTGTRAVRPRVRAPRPGRRHGHALPVRREGDARQLLGLVVRSLPRGVPAHGRAVSRVRPPGLRDRSHLGRRGPREDARVRAAVPAALSHPRGRRPDEADLLLPWAALLGAARPARPRHRAHLRIRRSGRVPRTA